MNSTPIPAATGFGAIRGLGYVFILCDDIERIKAFYTDVFSFPTEEEKPGTMIEFRVGGVLLGLRSRGRSYDGPSVPEPSASIQLSLRVPPADAGAGYSTLLAKGVEIIEKPTDQDWPRRTLYFKDSENNILEIFADIHSSETTDMPSGRHNVIMRASP